MRHESNARVASEMRQAFELEAEEGQRQMSLAGCHTRCHGTVLRYHATHGKDDMAHSERDETLTDQARFARAQHCLETLLGRLDTNLLRVFVSTLLLHKGFNFSF
jgi:hypothetical protein